MEILRFYFLIFLLCNLNISKSALAHSNQLFFNGGILYNICRDSNPVNQGACEGYILSVNDNIYSHEYKIDYAICFPKGVTPSQLRLQFIKYIENNPKEMNISANILVIKSLLKEYSCIN